MTLTFQGVRTALFLFFSVVVNSWQGKAAPLASSPAGVPVRAPGAFFHR
jgi:hypothetical protein